MKATKSNTPNILVREANEADIPQLVQLNSAAYPEMTGQNTLWGEEHIRSHLRIFPQGQLVAELDGKIVGASASLLINLGFNPLRQHTWVGITDNGYFTNHDPYGDTLYGADTYVHPDARNKGVGAALYEARRQLCRRLNKRRILAGGRLWGYRQYSEQMSPDEYAQRVVAGEFKDIVLSFQVHQGFTMHGVMPNYFDDPNSQNYATLIEWLNPEYKPSPSGARKVRIACVQYKMRKIKSFAEFARQVTYFIDVAANYSSDFVLLPEFFSMQLLSISSEKTLTPQEGIRKLTTYSDRFIELMRGLAQRFNISIVAGSHPKAVGDKLYNVSYICLPNGEIAEQPKLHITPSEKRWWGISGGQTLRVVETPIAKIGVHICYDIEFPISTRYLADEGAEIIFVPFCTDNRPSYMRVRYCSHARAIENQVYVALAGNVGNLPDVANMDIQYAQSAVLTPSDFEFARDGILAETEPNEEAILICDMDLNDLHKTHSEGTVTPRLDRRHDLFQVVTNFGEGHLPPPAK